MGFVGSSYKYIYEKEIENRREFLIFTNSK